MAALLYHTDLTPDETYPWAVPVITPGNGERGVGLVEDVTVAIPIATSALNTSVGRGATAVVDKSAKTVSMPDLTDWNSDGGAGQFQIDDGADGITYAHTKVEIASDPGSGNDAEWVAVPFSLSSKQIAYSKLGAIPDLVRVTVGCNIYGDTTTPWTSGTTITWSLDDSLETDTWDLVNELSEGAEEFAESLT